MTEIGRRVADIVKEASSIFLSELSGDRLSSHISLHSPMESIQTIVLIWMNAILVQQRLFTQEVSDIQAVFPSDVLPSQQLETWKKIHKKLMLHLRPCHNCT